MAGSLVSLEIVLCIIFGGFMLVLMVEVYYIFHSRHNREGEQGNLSTRERGFILNRGCNSFLGIRYFGRRLKHGIRYLIYGVNHQDNSFRRNSLLFNANNNNQERTAIVMEDEGQASTSNSTISFPSASSPPLAHCEFVAKLFPLQGDFSGDVDILQLQALLGPPRLLFTIKEETKEDLESEDAKSRAGRSRGASRASSEFIPLPDSGTVTPLETPFMTPPSSPLLTSPSISPPLPPLLNRAKHDGEEDTDDANSPNLLKPLNIFVDESSSSLSSSSSENFTPPIPSSPPKLLSTEETSSSSSSSTATPFIMSPQLLVHSQKHSRSSLGAFLDVPSQNRIYPIETPSFKNSDFVLMSNVEEVPLNVFPFKRIKESETVQLTRQFQQSGELSSTPSPSWPPSPPALPPSPLTPPLCSAHSSPLFTSPILGSVNGD